MITSQCGKLPCVQRTGSLPQRHYFSILRPRCKGAGRISGKVLAMLGRFCPRFPPSPRRFVKIVGNRPARHVSGPGGVGAQPAVPVCAALLPWVAPGPWRQPINPSLSSGPPAGRCKHRPLRRGGGAPRPSSARHACRPRSRRPSALHCRAGVHARRGALRQPGRILAEQDAAPLSRLTPTVPLTGEPSGRQFSQSLPCKGRWMRRKAQTEGCIAALPHRYPAKPGRTLPPHP